MYLTANFLSTCRHQQGSFIWQYDWSREIFWRYLSKFWNVFVYILKCICLNFLMYLSKVNLPLYYIQRNLVPGNNLCWTIILPKQQIIVHCYRHQQRRYLVIQIWIFPKILFSKTIILWLLIMEVVLFTTAGHHPLLWKRSKSS